MNATLVEPSLQWADQFLAMVHELRETGHPLANTEALDGAGMERYVAALADQAAGRGLQDWQVPMNTFWLLRDQQDIVGLSRVRHWLTPILRQHGGHIGYLIRPSARRLGLGRLILAHSLERARALGIDRVLVTCDADNIGSRRIIEANGGLLEAEAISPETGKMNRRYWIDVPAAPSPD